MAYDSAYYTNLYHSRVKEIHNLLGNKCCKCPCTEGLRIADDPAKKKDRFNLARCFSYKLEKVLKKAKKCSLYCEEHFKEMQRERRPWTHGTWYSSYKKKCGCEECDDYRADYALRRQEDRREKRAAAGLPPAQNTSQKRRQLARGAA